MTELPGTPSGTRHTWLLVEESNETVGSQQRVGTVVFSRSGVIYYTALKVYSWCILLQTHGSRKFDFTFLATLFIA